MPRGGHSRCPSRRLSPAMARSMVRIVRRDRAFLVASSIARMASLPGRPGAYSVAMSNSGRRGRGLRDQLRIHQVFAEEHFWRARNPFAQPVCVDPPPNPPRLAALHCPMCATSTQLDDLTADHAPPSGGQSSLGPAITAILTCRNCNNDAGHEGAAAAIARGQAPAFSHAELAQFSAARQGLEIILAHTG